MNKVSITWQDIFEFVDKLVLKYKNNPPDCILAIARGGVFIGTLLSYKLDIPVRYVGVSSYIGDKKTDNVHFTQHAEISEFKNILVIDDIIDSGDTIQFVKDVLGNSFDKHFEFVTMFAVEGKENDIDWYDMIKRKDEWVEFPWELI